MSDLFDILGALHATEIFAGLLFPLWFPKSTWLSENILVKSIILGVLELRGQYEWLLLGLIPPENHNLASSLLYICPWVLLKWRGPEVSAEDSRVQKYLLSAMTKVTKKDFCKIFSETTQCLHYESNYQIKNPVLLVCGAKEHTGNVKKTAPRWAAGKPNFEYHTIPLAGHCANMDNPGFFNQLLLDFLKRIYLK